MDRLSYLNFAFSVAENQLGPEGAKFLADALHVSTSMAFMDLSSNCLCGIDKATGIKAIADALSVSTSMNSLK